MLLQIKKSKPISIPNYKYTAKSYKTYTFHIPEYKNTPSPIYHYGDIYMKQCMYSKENKMPNPPIKNTPPTKNILLNKVLLNKLLSL